jgi:CRP/FNR family cyclic AMP-dependent transcriptional regulator
MAARPVGDVGSLAGTWFGSRLPEEARRRLDPYTRLARYPAGARILQEGEATSDLGIVRRGRVALRLRIPERGPTTILTVEPGDIVGWSAVVPPHRSTSTVVALLPTEMLLIDGPALRAELALDDELAAPVYLCLLEALARRLTGTRLQLLDLFTMSGVEPW